MAFVKREDLMFVELVHATDDAEGIAVEAMELCRDNELDKEKLVKACEAGHLSILEHNSFTFKIHCSTVTRTHFLRHRLCSFTERSLRSVEPEGIVLPIMENEQALNLMTECIDLSFQTYDALVKAGIAREDARYVLPQATTTDFFLTANARELLHIIKMRTSSHALAETRGITEKIQRVMSVMMPNIFTNEKIIQMA